MYELQEALLTAVVVATPLVVIRFLGYPSERIPRHTFVQIWVFAAFALMSAAVSVLLAVKRPLVFEWAQYCWLIAGGALLLVLPAYVRWFYARLLLTSNGWTAAQTVRAIRCIARYYGKRDLALNVFTAGRNVVIGAVMDDGEIEWDPLLDFDTPRALIDTVATAYLNERPSDELYDKLNYIEILCRRGRIRSAAFVTQDDTP